MTTETGTENTDTQTAAKGARSKKGIPLFTWINLLLLVGLLVLYVLFFMGLNTPRDQEKQMSQIEDRLSKSVSSIAYVNSDALMEQYELAVQMRADFAEEQNRLEGDLSRRQRSFQTEVEGFQRSLGAGTLPLDRAEVREQELMQMQQELIQLSDNYREQLAMKEYEMNVELLEKISDFLERYNNEMGHDFILGYSRGGGILYANEEHDITSLVLQRLNEEYRVSK